MCQLSIIIPIYNSEEYLDECIESIIKDKTSSFEVILINDGSEDNSAKICLSFVEKDSRIKYIYQENKGVSSARNNGISHASGKYIMFVDSDDMIEKNCIKNFLNKVEDNDFLCAGYKTFFENNIVNTYTNYNFKGDIKEFSNNISKWIDIPYLLSPWSKLFRTDIIRSNNILFLDNMSYGEDVVFVFEYLKYAKKIICLKETSYLYRISNTSLSHQFDDKMLEYNMIGLDYIEFFLNSTQCQNVKDISNQRLIKIYVLYIRNLMNSNLLYSEKKKIFFDKSKKYDILNICNITKLRSKSAKIIYIVLKFPFMFFLLYLLRIRRKEK